MMKPIFIRKIVFCTFCLSFSALLQAQSISDYQESAFDEAEPNIYDSLPPDASVEQARALANKDTLQPLMHLNGESSKLDLTEHFLPFNSRKADFIARLQRPFDRVFVNNQTVYLHSPELVRYFYSTQGQITVWTNENHFLPVLENLQNALLNSHEDGLNPELYHYQIIRMLNTSSDYGDIMDYELLLSDAYLTLAKHLLNGLTDPKKQHKTWNIPLADNTMISNVLVRGIISQNPGQALEEINANDWRYTALKNRYRILQNNQTAFVHMEKLPDILLKPGMRHPAIVLLRSKLGLPKKGGNDNYFDSELEQAVRLFQDNLGMSSDGIVGPSTRRLLNADSKSLMQKLLINMERIRWMPSHLGDPYILVNIPDFYAEMYQNGQLTYRSRVVVGTKRRPTPIFAEQMNKIVMNPYWNVPETIFKKDKLPRLRNDPNALGGSIKVISPSGKVVNPAEVDWSSPSANRYRLRQDPGTYNALGKIKFLFPNSHAIYMHDTPKKGLFKRANRAYSSGCIRLEKPLRLAEILLTGTEWDINKIKTTTSQRQERWVNPAIMPIVYLMYWTTWVDSHGKIQFADDIYGLDNKLLQEIKAANVNIF